MTSSTYGGSRSRFDELFDEAKPAILQNRHVCDVIPQEGGRWPISAVLLPAGGQAVSLVETTERVRPLVGPGHFLSGSSRAVHITVRALEYRREHVPAGDPAVCRYLDAARRAGLRSSHVRFQITGLTLQKGGLMAALAPIDAAADRLATALGEELGEDGWHEAHFRRTIWYTTLIHFTGPIARPVDLVDFVAERRQLDLGGLAFDRLRLVKYQHTVGSGGAEWMQCHEIGAALLTGCGAGQG